MRYLARQDLPQRAQRRLSAWTRELCGVPKSEQKAASDRTWRQRSRTTTIALARTTLQGMNGHRDRCMYCEHDRAGHIDHVEPRERQPERTFDWLNMVLSCERCNTAKGTKYLGPSGAPLIDPTLDDPAEHIELSPRDGRLIGLSPRGAWTVDALGLNASAGLRERRRHAWIQLQELIVRYSQLRAERQDEAAANLRDVITAHPFPGALVQLLSLSRDPDPGTVVRTDCLRALRDCPEIETWTRAPGP